MKIAMINGSPKLKESNSNFMLNTLKSMLPESHEIIHYNCNKKPFTHQQYVELCQVDTLVFAFPLYIDAIPSHLFRILVNLETYMKEERKREIFVYIIVNNGFYEGCQNHIAFEIIENWCERCGLHFGHGIGHGAGEMLGFIQNVPIEKGPLKNLGLAMKSLVNSILSRSGGDIALISPNFPRFAWKFSASHFFWHTNAKKNGLRIKDIVRKISPDTSCN